MTNTNKTVTDALSRIRDTEAAAKAARNEFEQAVENCDDIEFLKSVRAEHGPRLVDSRIRDLVIDSMNALSKSKWDDEWNGPMVVDLTNPDALEQMTAFGGQYPGTVFDLGWTSVMLYGDGHWVGDPELYGYGYGPARLDIERTMRAGIDPVAVLREGMTSDSPDESEVERLWDHLWHNTADLWTDPTTGRLYAYIYSTVESETVQTIVAALPGADIRYESKEN